MNEIEYKLSRPERWGSCFCFSKEVKLMPGGSYLSILTMDEFPKFNGISSIFGAEYAILQWPTKNGFEIGQGFLGDARSIQFIDNESFIILDIFNKLKIYTKKNRKFTLKKELFAEGINSFHGMTYLQIGAIKRDSIESDLESFIDNRNNIIIDRSFLSTKTYDGLVSKILFKGKIYLLGSNNGRNLELITPNGGKKQLEQSLDAFGNSNYNISEIKDIGKVIIDVGTVVPIEQNQKILKTLNLPFYSKFVSNSDGTYLPISYDNKNIIVHSKNYTTQAKTLKTEIKKWTSNNWYIKSITADTISNKYAILFGDISNDNKSALSLIDVNKKATSRHFCNEKNISLSSYRKIASIMNISLKKAHDTYKEYTFPLMKPTIKKIPFKILNYELGSDNSSIGVKAALPRGIAKGIILRLRGGPMSNLRTDSLPKYHLQLLKMGWAIYNIEYSGATSTSPRIFKRLSNNLDNALYSDAILIDSLLRKIKTKRTPVILLSESWGSALSSYVTQLSNDKISQVYLVAPAGEYLDPTEKFNDTDFYSDQNIIVRQVMHSTIGTPLDKLPIDINIWFKKRIKIFCSKDNYEILMGGDDDAVRLKPWIDACGKKLKVKIFNDTLHEINEEEEDIILKKASELTKLH